MKKNNKKYLFVSSDSVTKMMARDVNSISYMDIMNGCKLYDEKVSKEIFSKYGVLEEYQKIVIGLNSIDKHDAFEFITGYPFNLMKKKRKIGNFSVNIFGNNFNLNPGRNYIAIKTVCDVVSYDDVMNYFCELHSLGYLENYLRALMELFDLNVDLEFIFSERLNNTKSKTLRLYNKKDRK